MKKKQQLKLTVEKETIRRLTPRELSDSDLRKIAGGTGILTSECTYFCTSHHTGCL